MCGILGFLECSVIAFRMDASRDVTGAALLINVRRFQFSLVVSEDYRYDGDFRLERKLRAGFTRRA